MSPQQQEWTVTFNDVDFEGVHASTPQEALGLALEALGLGCPSMVRKMNVGLTAHLVPHEGKSVELLVRSGKEVGSDDGD